MTNEQKEQVQWSIDYALRKLQEIKADEDLHAQALNDRRMLADNNVVLLLEDVVVALPKALRVQVQTWMRGNCGDGCRQER